MTSYAIKNIKTNLFFGGFTKDNTVQWVSEDKAYKMDYESAKGQAALFACFNIDVQKKPVPLK